MQSRRKLLSRRQLSGAARWAGLVLLAVCFGGCNVARNSAAERLAKIPLLPPEEAEMGEPPSSGLSSHDPEWNDFEPYLQKLIQGVQKRWDETIVGHRYYPKQGSFVRVKFLLNSEGRVARILGIAGTADSLAGSWCVTAIAPNENYSYGRWTPEMVEKLGASQELTFTFLYQ